MIVTSYDLAKLRAGKTITVKIPAGRTAPGAKKPKPPVTVGREYAAQLAPFTPGKARIVVLALTFAGDAWEALITSSVQLEHPVFLAAGRGDYTLDQRHALRDEPEVIPFSFEERCAIVAKVTGQPIPERRPWKKGNAA